MKKDRAARFGDTNMAGISFDDARCNRCRHVSDDGLSCKAFPGGIPVEILSGKYDHAKPFASDHGIQFEAQKTRPAK